MSNFNYNLPKLKKLKKLAVICNGDINDLLFALPLLQTIKLHAPELKILLLGDEWHQLFVPERVPCIYQVFTIPDHLLQNDSSSSSNYDQKIFSHQLQSQNIDMVFQMVQGSSALNNLARSISNGFCIGFGDKNGELDITLPIKKEQPLALCNLEIANLLKVPSFSLAPNIKATLEDTQKLIDTYKLMATKPLAIISPGVRGYKDQNVLKVFSKITNWLFDHGFRIISVGDLEDAKIGHTLVTNSYARIEELSGLLSPELLLALVGRADLLIGSDGPTLQIAQAMNIKNIGLYYERSAYAQHMPLLLGHQRSVLIQNFENISKVFNEESTDKKYSETDFEETSNSQTNINYYFSELSTSIILKIASLLAE